MKSTPILTAAAAISLFAAACSSSGSGSNSNGAGAAAFKVEVANGAVAGSPVAVTVTALNPAGATLTGYRGSITLSTDDAQATLPGTVSFGSSAQGTVTTSITFKGAGVHVVTATDSASASGSTRVTVSSAAASACIFLDLPGTAGAGAAIAARVTVADAFGNVAMGYTGTMHVTSSDTAAQLPGDQTWLSLDRGTHAIAVRLITGGNQTITLTDAANASISCTSGAVSVQPGAPHLVLTLPADLNAGVQATASVAAVDAFGNAATSYAGTVNLASSDASATLPTSLTMAGGHGSFAVTFATVGSQTVTGTDAATAGITGGAAVRVHGLVYTDPPAQLASAVRLVLNLAASNARVVQLDLVANRSVPSGFAVGMNLPADPSRIALDSTPLVEGNVFSPGSAPKAEAISLRSDVLYSGLSQKAGGAGGGASDVAVPAGGIYYSIRLALNPTATVGAVFDGATAMPKFRAAVRDILGNDTVTKRNFAVGRLEIR